MSASSSRRFHSSTEPSGRTHPLLPGNGEDIGDPTTWTAFNSGYAGPDYLPRYYVFNETGTIPIYSKGIYYDSSTGTWVGKEHVSNWDTSALTLAYPAAH